MFKDSGNYAELMRQTPSKAPKTPSKALDLTTPRKEAQEPPVEPPVDFEVQPTIQPTIQPTVQPTVQPANIVVKRGTIDGLVFVLSQGEDPDEDHLRDYFVLSELLKPLYVRVMVDVELSYLVQWIWSNLHPSGVKSAAQVSLLFRGAVASGTIMDFDRL